MTGAPGLDLPALETADVAARLRRRARARVRGRDELREALDAGARLERAGSWSRWTSRPAWRCSDERRWPPRSRRRRSRPSDRVPDELASGTPAPLRAELEALLGPERVLPRVLDLVRYASDASPYRLLPQAVVMAHDADDVAKVLAFGRRAGIPGHAALRRHQPQRPGAGRRHPRRRPAPLRAAFRVDGRGRSGARATRGPCSATRTARSRATAAASDPIPPRPTSPRSAA